MSNNPSSDTIQLDLRRWFSNLLSWWWLILLSLLLAMFAGHLYLRYTTYQYRSSAIILVKDTGKEDLVSAENILLSQTYNLGQKGMDNEMQILSSSPLFERVIKNLGINISYYRQGRFREQEYYQSASIQLDTFSLLGESASFFIQMLDNDHFLFSLTKEDEGSRQRYGEPFQSPLGMLQFSVRPTEKIIPGTYRVSIQAVKNVASYYRSSLVIERIGSLLSSSLLKLILKDPIPEKAEDILRNLITVYNEEEVENKNKVLLNTLDFIDSRLGALEQELDLVESSIEVFRRQNELVSSTASSSKSYAVGEMRGAIAQIAQFETKKEILASLAQFVSEQQDSFQLLPTNLVAENPSLGSLLGGYNARVLDWQQLSTTASAVNPIRLDAERDLKDLRASLLLSIQQAREDLNIPLNRLAQNVQELEAKMLSVPAIEKELLERERLQSIKENLYLSLLQKREETALSVAVSTSGNRVVEPPSSSRGPIYPKKQLVLLACALLGILIPVTALSLYDLLDTKIRSEEEVKRLTQIPIMGRIVSHKGDEKVIATEGRRSAINEMFRQLRTNLNYLNLKNENQVLSISSYKSGEGKSFVALNLALTYSLSDKKTILLELDLRKPKLRQYLSGNTRPEGITNYLTGQNDLSEVTQRYNNLDFICSGPIPPNPAELLESEKMKALLQYLATQYDRIIIDNSPIGLVSDALLLREYINNTLLIIRHNNTDKSMLRHLDEMYQADELPNAGIILNGIKQHAGYANYRGYLYNQDYHE